MTRLEKAKELRPELSESETIKYYCPENLLPLKTVKCNAANDGDCIECWKEEYKEETKA